MSDIDKWQDGVIASVARAAAHEGTALGTGDPIDRITDAVIGLRHATKSDFVERYGVVNKALHENWTRRVGTPNYKKSVWFDVDVALSTFARLIARSVGHEGPWILILRTDPERPAQVGDHYRFTYPNESKFNKTLLVKRTFGDGPEDLVLFEDRSYSKQKNLNKPGAERVSP